MPLFGGGQKILQRRAYLIAGTIRDIIIVKIFRQGKGIAQIRRRQGIVPGGSESPIGIQPFLLVRRYHLRRIQTDKVIRRYGQPLLQRVVIKQGAKKAPDAVKVRKPVEVGEGKARTGAAEGKEIARRLLGPIVQDAPVIIKKRNLILVRHPPDGVPTNRRTQGEFRKMLQCRPDRPTELCPIWGRPAREAETNVESGPFPPAREVEQLIGYTDRHEIHVAGLSFPMSMNK